MMPREAREGADENNERAAPSASVSTSSQRRSPLHRWSRSRRLIARGSGLGLSLGEAIRPSRPALVDEPRRTTTPDTSSAMMRCVMSQQVCTLAPPSVNQPTPTPMSQTAHASYPLREAPPPINLSSSAPAASAASAASAAAEAAAAAAASSTRSSTAGSSRRFSSAPPESVRVRNDPGSFPALDDTADMVGVSGRGGRGDEGAFDRLMAKVPESVWQPNAVVPQHRNKANLYWAVLLSGYLVYIALAFYDAYDRRKSPPVQLTEIEDPFQLPDVGFCFEGDTYGSRFGCFDGDADGEECAGSFNGDVFVYGYNYTGYTTPEGYDQTDEYVVLLPEALSETCMGFRLSALTATEQDEDADAAWRFHMLMFWNSSYDPVSDAGAFESTKMYLYEGGLSPEEVVKTPITLYAPISFDPAEVPFVRGFLEYEQQVSLAGDIHHTYKVVDTTSAPWHNAEDASDLAVLYGTDTLASIQIDIRTQSYYQYSEVDPLDIVGTLGEISGFWLVVPLLFGVMFYRPQNPDDDPAEMRSFSICERRHGKAKIEDSRSDFHE